MFILLETKRGDRRTTWGDIHEHIFVHGIIRTMMCVKLPYHKIVSHMYKGEAFEQNAHKVLILLYFCS